MQAGDAQRRRVPAALDGARGDAGAVADGWLASFNDPRLDALVDEALAYNADLRIAAARVEQAAGYVKAAGATLLSAGEPRWRAAAAR